MVEYLRGAQIRAEHIIRASGGAASQHPGWLWDQASNQWVPDPNYQQPPLELKSGIFNRFKSEKQETKDIPQPELFTYENIQDTEDISDFEADAQKETFETALDEKPYIEDSKQFSFYLTRNMKTFFTLLAISVLIVRGFRLFLDSMKIIIDNLL